MIFFKRFSVGYCLQILENDRIQTLEYPKDSEWSDSITMPLHNTVYLIKSGCELSWNYINRAEMLFEKSLYISAILLGEMAITAMLRTICLSWKGILDHDLNYFTMECDIGVTLPVKRICHV